MADQAPGIRVIKGLFRVGFIARYPGHASDWTSKEDHEHLQEMEDKSDVLLLAKKTYEVAKENLAKRNCLILTRSTEGIEEARENEVYINPQKADLEKYIGEKGYIEVCILGGRGAYSFALEKNLIDDIYITIEPIMFGEGICAFSKKIETRNFELIKTKNLNENGSLLLHYRKK